MNVHTTLRAGEGPALRWAATAAPDRPARARAAAVRAPAAADTPRETSRTHAPPSAPAKAPASARWAATAAPSAAPAPAEAPAPAADRRPSAGKRGARAPSSAAASRPQSSPPPTRENPPRAYLVGRPRRDRRHTDPIRRAASLAFHPEPRGHHARAVHPPGRNRVVHRPHGPAHPRRKRDRPARRTVKPGACSSNRGLRHPAGASLASSREPAVPPPQPPVPAPSASAVPSRYSPCGLAARPAGHPESTQRTLEITS